MQQPPSAGQLSPDGRWRWNGAQWIPNEMLGVPGAPPPKRRHTARSIGLGCGGAAAIVVILIIIIATVASKGGGGSDGDKSQAGTATTTPPASAAPTAAPTPTPTASVAILTVSGNAPQGVDVTTNTDTSQSQPGNVSLPWMTTIAVTSNTEYVALTAQLLGSGQLTCSVAIGTYVKSGTANGGYSICDAQLNQLLGAWS